MKLKTKIGLGLASIVLASVPLFIKSKEEQNEFMNESVDVIIKDTFESYSVKNIGPEYASYKKVYFLSNGRKFVVFTIPENHAVGKNHKFFSKNDCGTYVEDLTPERFGNYKIIGCRVYNKDKPTELPFSQDIEEIVEQAKMNIFYRNIEKRIMNDVSENGTELSRTYEPLFDVPIVRYLFKFTVSTTKEKTYFFSDGVKITANVTLWRDSFSINYDIDLGDNMPWKMFRYNLGENDAELPNINISRSISGKRLEQLNKLID